jgi:hypothetical protein
MIELPEGDDELFAELRAVLDQEDRVPSSVVGAARGALAWRSIDEELAMLSLDSLLETTSSGVRGGSDRQLTFETTGLTIELDVIDGGRQVMGQLVPPLPAKVEVQLPGVTSTVHADTHGQFSARGALGPFRLHVRSDTGVDVVTEWITL